MMHSFNLFTRSPHLFVICCALVRLHACFSDLIAFWWRHLHWINFNIWFCRWRNDRPTVLTHSLELRAPLVSWFPIHFSFAVVFLHSCYVAFIYAVVVVVVQIFYWLCTLYIFMFQFLLCYWCMHVKSLNQSLSLHQIR
jgi:hypothetical protein